ncbi:MAG: cobyrinate a,c-diamide synthase [Methanophagales archaeon]|nr:cobyrinate a,c-diamide synthase [Methanophagales archaeon]
MTSISSAFAVAGTHSGVGKTTLAVGLISAFRRRGYDVQPFKAGPDFIDTSLHTLAAGKPSRNLDTFMMSRSAVIQSFRKNTSKVNIVEGVMGLFDGASAAAGGQGSTSQLAKLLDIQVVLVVDASGLAGSVSALVHGYMTFDPSLKFAGVILNRVGSKRHRELLEEALRGVTTVFGTILKDEAVKIPERHLGLFMAHEVDRTVLNGYSKLVEENIDMDSLLEATEVDIPSAEPEPKSPLRAVDGVRVGVAMDEAFCFYYPENLDILRNFGAEVVPFSPLRGALPDVDAFYIGGGYPELYAEQLEENGSLREALADAIRHGSPLYAECGGLLYCLEQLEDKEMLGLFKGSARLTNRLHAVGYVEAVAVADSLLFPRGARFRGHEFHYSTVNGVTAEFAYELLKGVGIESKKDGIFRENVLASYTHLHALGNEKAFLRFLETAAAR